MGSGAERDWIGTQIVARVVLISPVGSSVWAAGSGRRKAKRSATGLGMVLRRLLLISIRGPAAADGNRQAVGCEACCRHKWRFRPSMEAIVPELEHGGIDLSYSVFRFARCLALGAGPGADAPRCHSYGKHFQGGDMLGDAGLGPKTRSRKVLIRAALGVGRQRLLSGCPWKYPRMNPMRVRLYPRQTL